MSQKKRNKSRREQFIGTVGGAAVNWYTGNQLININLMAVM